MKDKTKKTTAKRRTISRKPPGQAIAAMKTFIESERIKGIIGLEDSKFLTKHDRLEIILNMARRIRNTGGLDEDEAFFFMSIALDQLAEERILADAELTRINAAIGEKEAGLAEAEFWLTGEAPDDVEELRNIYDDRCRQVEADVMRELGEGKMADLYLNDEKEYYRRRTRGALCVYKGDEAKLEEAKKLFREIFIKHGWEDLLPGLGMKS